MRVALLQNFIAPYRVSLYEKLSCHVKNLRFFISTPMEDDRKWKVEWGTLDVIVQKNFTIYINKKDKIGFTRRLQLHIPYDTISQLWRYNPDAIISVELGMRSLQAVIYKIIRPSTRLLLWCKLSEHSERQWGRGRFLLRKFLMLYADGVLVNGESGARYISQFKIPDNRVFRINQPVDIEMFSSAVRMRSDTACVRLLCCGVLSDRKGVLPFLKQLAIWTQAHPLINIELWWVGSGELLSSLENYPTRSNLKQKFIGEVAYTDLPNWYSQIDILAFPTLLDEWGLVVNEAMASGIPVLGSIFSQAVTELVTEGVTGWIFDPTSNSSVQDALDRMHQTSPDQLVKMRQAARDRIATLTPASAAAKIHEALEIVADHKKNSHSSHYKKYIFIDSRNV